MEQISGTGRLPGFEAVVAHDHPVDDPQLPVNLAQMLSTVVVAHIPGQFLRPRLALWKQVQMGVNDLHKVSLLLQGGFQP